MCLAHSRFTFFVPTPVPIVTDATDQNTYARTHGLNLVSSHDAAISALSNVGQDPDCPVIQSGSPITTNQKQPITITGSGFGSQQPYSGDSPYITILDYTATPYWVAGHTSDVEHSLGPNLVTLDVSQWTDSQIVIAGFDGSYGSNNWTLHNGDKVYIYVSNPQGACERPAFYTTTVTAPPIPSCPTGQTLNSNGVCTPIQCPSGQQLVNGVCTIIQCPTGQQLVNGVCTIIQCPTGEELNANGICTPIQSPQNGDKTQQ